MSAESAAVLLAGCRWLVYLGVLGLVGVAGAQLVFRRVQTEAFRRRRPDLAGAMLRTTNLLALLWIFALLSTLATNIVVWFGPAGLIDGHRIDSMLFDTRWGNSWVIAFGAAVLSSALQLIARFVGSLRPAALATMVIAAIVPTPLLGHAAGHGTTLWLLHSGHLFGTGLWLGTVFVVVIHGWSYWREPSGAALTLQQILAAISPVALTGASIAMMTGVWMSAAHVWPPRTVLDTAYGSTLAVKTSIVLLIAVLGWLNWRRFGPAASRPEARRRLRESVVAELCLGLLVVLILTAWLSGLPMPM